LGKRAPNYAALFLRRRRKCRFSKRGKLSGKNSFSTAKYGSLGILKEGRIRLKEKNFWKGDHVMLDGQPWGIKKPGVFLDKSQKIFFICIGEVFPDQQIDVLVVGMVQVGHI
jgi:hypothetical protein